MIKNFLILLLFCWCVSSYEIPSFVHLCKRNDPNIGLCFLNTIHEIIPHLLKGIPEMDIPPLDPLRFKNIKIDTGNGASVNVVVELINGTATGLQHFRAKNAMGDFKTMIFTVDLEIPLVQIEASYKIRGKILLFEINGSGNASFTGSDLKTTGVWTGSTYTKNSKTYLNTDKISFNGVQIQNVRFRLDNLFGENQLLTETVNNAINDNIKSLQSELEPLIKETLGEAIREYFNRVYRRFSMDQLFPID